MSSYNPHPAPLPGPVRPLWAVDRPAQTPPARNRLAERVGDHERSAVCDELSAHYGLGRLNPVELDARLDLAVGARTRADLAALVADLPAARPAEPETPPTDRFGPGPALWLALAVPALMFAGLMLAALVLYRPALGVPAIIGGGCAFLGGFATAKVIGRR